MESMSLPSQDNETYLSRVHDLAFSWGLEDVVESLSKPDTASTKAFYINYAQRLTISTPAQITAAASELDGNIGRYTVCIVENIAPEHIEALGSAWDLDPAFFVQYASNRQRGHLWMPDVFGGDRPGTDRKPYDHIDGNFEYHGICVQSDAELDSAPNYFARHCFRKTWDEVETVNSNTRISYYRVHRELCEFFISHFYRPLTVLFQICSSWTRRYTCKTDTVACLGGSGPLCDYHTPSIAAVFFYRNFLNYMTDRVFITVSSSL